MESKVWVICHRDFEVVNTAAFFLTTSGIHWLITLIHLEVPSMSWVGTYCILNVFSTSLGTVNQQCLFPYMTWSTVCSGVCTSVTVWDLCSGQAADMLCTYPQTHTLCHVGPSQIQVHSSGQKMYMWSTSSLILWSTSSSFMTSLMGCAGDKSVSAVDQHTCQTCASW